MTGTQCNYMLQMAHPKKRCQNDAVLRSPVVARCLDHAGHHDYFERWNGTRWVEQPAETRGFDRPAWNP